MVRECINGRKEMRERIKKGRELSGWEKKRKKFLRKKNRCERGGKEERRVRWVIGED